jgi:hypothetical protein
VILGTAMISMSVALVSSSFEAIYTRHYVDQGNLNSGADSMLDE